MPWDNNSGNNQNPWGNGGGSGNGPNRGPRGMGGNEPDIDEIIRQGARAPQPFASRCRRRFRPCRHSAVLFGLWALIGLLPRQADEQGVVLRFGKFHTQTAGFELSSAVAD